MSLNENGANSVKHSHPSESTVATVSDIRRIEAAHLSHTEMCQLIHGLQTEQIKLETQVEELKKTIQNLTKSHGPIRSIEEGVGSHSAPKERDTIQENERRLRESQAIARLGSFHWNAVTNQVIWSDQLFRIYGRDPASFEPSFENYIACVHPNDRPHVLQTLQNAMATLGEFEHEYLAFRPDGRYCWIHARGRAIVNEDGQFVGMEGTCQDTTDRKTAETGMIEALNRLEKIASRVPGMVYELRLRPDGTMCFPYASEGMRTIFQVGPEEVNVDGTKFFSRVHPEDIASLHLSTQTSAEELSLWSHEFRLQFSDGTERWISGTAAPTREPDGSTLWHGYVADITDRKQAEKNLIVVHTAAEEANRAKSAFLANMSHEIRTPLTAMLGFAEILGEEDNSPHKLEHRKNITETIKKSGKHLLTIINDILDLSKIEANKMTVEKVSTSPLSLLCEVETLMLPSATGKGVSLDVSLTSPLPDSIYGDPTRLRQVLLNLVGNSIKFTEAGRIQIKASSICENNCTLLVVDIEDTGMGMSGEQTERVFSPFGQGDNSMTRIHGGTGLGLSLSRRFARMMGGDVQLLHTEIGRGSCFRMQIPLEAVADARWFASLEQYKISLKCDAAAEPPAANKIRLSGRILLAEDGIDNQRLIAFHLRSAGATVETADNGRIALEMIERQNAAGTPFDLLVSDMQMPEMDGYSLARTLREAGSKIPILALTANAMSDDELKCIDAGCDGYTTKPISKSVLLSKCEAWLGRRK
jgi:PAS domain S-box-containing protein